MTALHQQNAEALQKQWIKGGRKLDRMEPNDILKLTRKTRKFNNMNEDSEFNLDRMIQMQNDAADQDECHGKTHRHMYGGVPRPVW